MIMKNFIANLLAVSTVVYFKIDGTGYHLMLNINLQVSCLRGIMGT